MNLYIYICLYIYHPMTWVDYYVCVFAHHFNMTQRPLDLAIESINWHLIAVNLSLKTDHPIKAFNSKTEHIANIMCIWVNHMHALYNLYAPLTDSLAFFIHKACVTKSHIRNTTKPISSGAKTNSFSFHVSFWPISDRRAWVSPFADFANAAWCHVECLFRWKEDLKVIL